MAERNTAGGVAGSKPKARVRPPSDRANQQHNQVMALLEAAALVERRLDSALANICGISFSEYRLLLALSGCHEATATRVSVARQVGLTPSAVTRAFKPLEKLGFIRSAKSERDARRSLATLTAAGFERVSDAQRVVADQVAELPLTAVPDEGLQQLHADLRGVSSRESSGQEDR